MNDHEPFTNQTDAVANAGPSPTPHVRVAKLGAIFRDEITKALADGRAWAEIASALSTSGIAARPDAVRMAYRRHLDQRHQPSARPPVRPTTMDQLVPTQRSADPPRSSDMPSSKPPSLAPRIR